MKPKHSEEFEKFDQVMGGLLAVPYSELQKKLEQEKREKAKHKKKRSTSTASSRASSSRKRRVA
jgi:inner membrane protein involved in colicin E2 resistance